MVDPYVQDPLEVALRERDDEIVRLRTALREIEKGEGEFSRDRLTHCTNTVESMKAIATKALEESDG